MIDNNSKENFGGSAGSGLTFDIALGDRPQYNGIYWSQTLPLRPWPMPAALCVAAVEQRLLIF